MTHMNSISRLGNLENTTRPPYATTRQIQRNTGALRCIAA